MLNSKEIHGGKFKRKIELTSLNSADVGCSMVNYRSIEPWKIFLFVCSDKYLNKLWKKLRVNFECLLLCSKSQQDLLQLLSQFYMCQFDVTDKWGLFIMLLWGNENCGHLKSIFLFLQCLKIRTFQFRKY